MNSFTVVICTYKRHFLIQRCLEGILNNSLSPDRIILIDQNYDYLSYNKILKVFENKKFKNFLIIRNTSQKGLTKSKNIALEKIITKYVFFIDDDIIIEKNFFKKNIKVIFEKKAHAVSGIISNYKKNLIKDFVYHLFNFGIFRDNRNFFTYQKTTSRNYIHKTFQVPGGITCYDMKIFKKLSFDDKFITHNYEDVEFNIRLKKIYKKPKLFINSNSLAYDKLLKSTKENFYSRVYFMTLLFLRNKNYKNLIFFILSLLGFLISCFFSFKIKNLRNLKTIMHKAFLKSKM